MKSNTILCSLIISGIAATATATELETTYARYHRNLSKAGKGEFGSKSTKSPTAITSSGSKSSKGSGSKSSKSSGQTLEVSKQYNTLAQLEDVNCNTHKSNI